MNTENGVIKDARSLGTPKMLILGLQHMFAMFGATILVPIFSQQLFPRRGTFNPGYFNLCRNRNFIFPFLHQDESTCVFRFLFCFSWRIRYRCRT